MLRSQYPRPNSVLLAIGLTSLSMLPLAREGGGEIGRTRERVRMLQSQHALSHGEHLAVDLVRLRMLPLV